MPILSTAPGIRLLSVELKEVEAQWAGALVAPSRVFLPLSTQNTHGSTSQAPILGTTSLDNLQRESISFTSLHRTSLPSETETPQCRKRFVGLHTFHPGADHQEDRKGWSAFHRGLHKLQITEKSPPDVGAGPDAQHRAF